MISDCNDQNFHLGRLRSPPYVKMDKKELEKEIKTLKKIKKLLIITILIFAVAFFFMVWKYMSLVDLFNRLVDFSNSCIDLANSYSPEFLLEYIPKI